MSGLGDSVRVVVERRVILFEFMLEEFEKEMIEVMSDIELCLSFVVDVVD